MRIRSSLYTALLLLGIGIGIFSCGPRETGEKDVVLFSVNMETKDSYLDVSALEGDAQIYVYCSGAWTYTLREYGGTDREHWLILGTPEQDQDNFWSLPLHFSENEGLTAREQEVAFLSGNQVFTVTVRQGVMDPILRNHVPGFYGVNGGDVALEPGRDQSGLFHIGNLMTYRIQEPYSLDVAALSDIPRLLRVGQTFPLRYKRVHAGMQTVWQPFPSVSVVHLDEAFIWLKAADSEAYFVIER